MSKRSNTEKLIALKEKRDAKARKRKRIIVGIFSGLIAAVVLTVVLLSVLKPKTAVALEPNNELPVSIQIIFNGGFDWEAGRNTETIEMSRSGTPKARESDYNAFVDAYKSAVTFSYSYGILDNQWFPGMFLTKDSDNELVEVKKADIDAFSASTDSPLIVVRFDKVLNVTIDKVTIPYTHVFFKISESGNQIIKFKTYLVNSVDYRSPNLQTVQNYCTYEINTYGNTSKIYNVITEIKDRT